MKRRSGTEVRGFSLVLALGRLFVRDVCLQGELLRGDGSRGQGTPGLCCAHARRRSVRRSPGTNSPPDCLCPGSLPRHRPLADGSSLTSLRTTPARHELPAPWLSDARVKIRWQGECGRRFPQRSKGGGLGRQAEAGGHERRGPHVALGACNAGTPANAGISA